MVYYISDDAINVTWDVPFSLDINETITYCVRLLNTEDSLDEYIACNVFSTFISIPYMMHSFCEEYNVTVTPHNIVGNGSSSTVVISNEGRFKNLNCFIQN